MGVVTDATGRRFTLGRRTTIGRSRGCTLRIESAAVSAEHSCIFWHRDRWYVRDLGSTNGTWLNGDRLTVGARAELRRGTTLDIGDVASRLTLVDAGSPVPRARDLESGEVVEGTQDLVQLPDVDAIVYEDGDGWMMEHDGGLRRVGDGVIVEIDGARFALELPALPGDDAVTTAADVRHGIALERARLSFRVSRDEEYVELTVIDRGRATTLPPRGFHYLLLTLARRRLADVASGLEPAEHGWMYADELARLLATTKPKINLDICRARQQLAENGVLGAARIVERRPTTHQLRIGAAALDELPFEEPAEIA